MTRPYTGNHTIFVRLFVTLFSEASTHNDAHTTPTRIAMSSNATLGVETRSCKRKRERDANAGEAIPGLLNDIVVTHVLRSEHFGDPAYLARLRVVSPAMRGAVRATGIRLKEVDEDDAVWLGCLSAVQRLQRRGLLSHQELLCEAAARGGHLEELEALRGNGTPWDYKTCMVAAYGGHLEVLQWARTNGCPWGGTTCYWAAVGGHLEVLQWARANGCPWHQDTCGGAAMEGHLEVLQWARANGAPWDERTCASATMDGRLEVLQWLRANGCPWDEETCVNAAWGGHLDVLQWAHANGCEWSRWTLINARANGHLELLKWARANGCPE